MHPLQMYFLLKMGIWDISVTLDPSILSKSQIQVQLSNGPNRQVCQVSWSGPKQGQKAHVDRYKNSPVMHKSLGPDQILIHGEKMHEKGKTCISMNHPLDSHRKETLKKM